MRASSPHEFHIPVMGTGFTVDTPIRVAKFGISSVISIGDDILIEKMRQYHCGESGRPFEPIGRGEPDARARRITAYLDLVDDLVRETTEEVRRMPFKPGNDLSRYYEMLPDGSTRDTYREMLDTDDSDERNRLQNELREAVVAGDIDVNIMAKADRDAYRKGEKQEPEQAMAMAALRGFARSKLHSAVVFSAGMNRRLYKYLSRFEDFFPKDNVLPKKSIVLKVSDVRSALLQSRLLAKLGLWVAEYRIESGLNCGGHAFATKGKLLGPILQEFMDTRDALAAELSGLYHKALERLDIECDQTPPVNVTVQGGIGTSHEHQFLLKRYRVSSTGWGTPFLLVPEATNVDDEHLEKLTAATEKDVELSRNSPLGVQFWSLMTSASEQTRRRRIAEGKPGSPCPKGYLGLDSEFSEIPICRASRQYQKLKSDQLQGQNLTPQALKARLNDIVAKACICVDLAGGALLRNGLSEKENTAVCCGPNIAHFDQIVSLKEMVDHIYGRLSLIRGSDRPHMFIKELSLYISQLRDEIVENSAGLLDRTSAYFTDFIRNLEHGVEYYRELAGEIGSSERTSFLQGLDTLSNEIEQIWQKLQDASPALFPVPATDTGA